MKKTLRLSLLAAVAVIMICTTSCKKKGVSTPDCRIKSYIHEKAGVKDTTIYSYNNDGKVIAVVMGVANVVYTYSGSTINRTYTSGLSSSRDSIIIGSNGFVNEDYNFFDDGTISRKNVYSYNTNNELTQITETTYPAMTVGITNLTYSNGDIVGETGAVIATIEYYDKPAALGDYWYLTQFLNYGAFFYHPKHLFKTLISGGTTNNFAYEFDSNGNVSKMTITEGANIDTYTIDYFCD